ncbi:response regulator [Corticibacter populi]|uniref:histidine kinase n=1 Tax=Corticibacter populi TaxID=1550736 RepID=A0A3M6QPP3_9BURK|nr:PAS domain-containing hybrid sensor histidine kinase/response regulator [Corticibacter populi]RMX05016.1 response regulator [Corticibacter populi]RZS33552.1 Na+/proline symporter [Corticibacter populi]
MQPGWVILVSLLYAAMLFAVAWLGDRHPHYVQRGWLRTGVYSLALAVYCSSWTFYGAVGTAARYGLGYLPIYLGPLLMFLLGWRMIERLALVAKSQNTVSIADFIGSRFGRSPRLAALVTVIALIAAVPYLALQYRAVVSSLSVLTGADTSTSHLGDPALYVAIIMALFAILFGTRQVDATEHRPGLMLAVALESLVKLVALVAIGLLALHWFGGYDLSAVEASRQLLRSTTPVGFTAQTLLAFAAIICLPRQFHVAIVECGEVADIRRARWLFGLYLVIVSAMVLPIAAAGVELFGMEGGVAPDSFVLALPLALNRDLLALGAYIGGFSAATGMVIVVSVALSNMVSNDLVMPLLLRRGWLSGPAGTAGTAGTAAAPRRAGGDAPPLANMAPTVLWVRRLSIMALAALAYGYSRGTASHTELASFGLMAFAAVAQFAPALLAGLYWHGASRRGVEAGLLAGFGVWCYTLLLPSFVEAGWLPGGWLATGPFGLDWLRPHHLFGSRGWDALTHGTFWSLLLNVLTLVLVSLRWRPGLTEQMQAQPFLAPPGQERPRSAGTTTFSQADLRVRDLQTVAAHIIGAGTAERAFAGQARTRAIRLEPELRADRRWVHFTELLLTGAVGASSARLVMTRALQGSGMELAAVMAVLDEAGQELRFNRNILLATLENIDPGVSVVDAEMRLVAWNLRYQQLFDYPDGMLYVGRQVAELIGHNLQRGLLGKAPPANVQVEVDKRIAYMRAGSAYTFVRQLPDGRFIELRGHPLPDGGYVTSYSDITAFKQAERELREINETLEQRVAERSRELAAAHESRSRYLTAISHDVLQPIHAARLFASALREEHQPAQMQHLAEHVDTALHAAEELLDGILDISRLDAGALQPDIAPVNVQPLLQELVAQYTPLAQRRGLRLRLHARALWVRSDARLLRRVLQNFVANALRYTQSGRIVLAARVRGAAVQLQVWDSGPGIPQAHLQNIYEEFHRYQQHFDWDGRGLGLGLSICQRIARLLTHRLDARSVVGRGSMFSIEVPRCAAPASAATAATARAATSPADLRGMKVLCLDNDPEILAGMRTLLGRWGVQALCAASLDEARQAMAEAPDFLLSDFHLHEQCDGIEALDTLRRQAPRLAGALLTADGSDALKTRARAHGYAVLTKPAKPASLRSLLAAQRSSAGALNANPAD